MKPRHLGILLALLTAPYWPANAAAQEVAAPADQVASPASQAASPNAMPQIEDLLRLADKASSPTAEKQSSDWSAPVKLAIVFAVLAVLPSLLVMMTSFTRIVIVLAFVRRAMTTQAIPPTIALIGLALFLTIFTMSSTLQQINAEVIRPYLQDEIPFELVIEKSNGILKDFMLHQTRSEDLALFVDLSGMDSPTTASDVPTYVAIPAFAISEFRTAFEMGFLLFIPFLLVDIVIAGVLLSAGMMMLPPIIISLPFKIILFILVDGWRLLAESLVTSFAGV